HWTRSYHLAADPVRMCQLMRFAFRAASWAAVGIALLAPRSSRAQQPATTGPQPPEVGAMAPDFVMSGATRFGVLRDSFRLYVLRGQTVLLAFFLKARTRC